MPLPSPGRAALTDCRPGRGPWCSMPPPTAASATEDTTRFDSSRRPSDTYRYLMEVSFRCASIPMSHYFGSSTPTSPRSENMLRMTSFITWLDVIFRQTCQSCAVRRK